ncbi:hypothetical protein MMH89_00870 [Candidatus Comchoanobacter bicostacola]|uniref:F-box domain-containing protein n=1 Tax=Candidatus Comchoanobacter bicostacola TaxID=2919598 RepID=A0ABY5DLT7_9GAMM|nr:hypothetical protein [Candidatus Comchoanobacter bicostacola]UTC24715.1 hypothetical protein MMH89_00870 [Candidatus Comchoanobacter bicostacola]
MNSKNKSTSEQLKKKRNKLWQWICNIATSLKMFFLRIFKPKETKASTETPVCPAAEKDIKYSSKQETPIRKSEKISLFDTLPDELIIKIFDFIARDSSPKPYDRRLPNKVAAVMRLGKACKRLYKLATSSQEWLPLAMNVKEAFAPHLPAEALSQATFIGEFTDMQLDFVYPQKEKDANPLPFSKGINQSGMLDGFHDKCDVSRLGFSPQHLSWDDLCYGKCDYIARKAHLTDITSLSDLGTHAIQVAYGYWYKAQVNHSTPFILYKISQIRASKELITSGWPAQGVREETVYHRETLYRLSFIDESENFVDGLRSIKTPPMGQDYKTL